MNLDEKYIPDTAIVGLWFGLNYGSILSAYALYKAVEDMGYQPVFMNKPVGFWGKKYENPDNIAGKFIHKHCYVSPEFYDGDTLFEFTKQRENFIVGSDVVWNYEICGKEAGGFFFLDFVPEYKNKISYASSFGSGFGAEGYVKVHTENLLKHIPKRAVGDVKTLEILNTQFSMNAKLVIDPLFLTEKYNFAIEEKKEDFIFAYLENCDAQKRKILSKAIEVLEVKSRNYADINDFEQSKKKYKMPVEESSSVERWVNSIKNSNMVITDSYFAMCMAIIFKKPFIVLAPKTLPDLNRYTFLLKELGLLERLVYVEEDMTNYYYLIKKPIKYHLVEKKLEVLKKESLEWLHQSLTNTN